jgi:PAS domain S-box-containing protein
MSSGSAPIPGPNTDQLLAAIIDSSDDAIFSENPEGTITSWNKSAERIYGYTAAEMIGRNVSRLVPPDRHGEEVEISRRIRAGERIHHLETFRQRKDGQRVKVSMSVSPIRAPQGEIIGASKVVRDITQQAEGERAGQWLAAIVTSSEDAIVSKNLDGIITSWNAAAERMFGYTVDEAIGQSVLMLLPMDRKEEESQILEQLRRGVRIEHFETIRVRKNGESFPVSLTISPVRDGGGRIIGASKIARDITELKRIRQERERLLESERSARAHAEHASRMKDDFLATVSHELRTPLNAIVGWAEVLKEGPTDATDLARAIEVIERNARIQAQLIDDLLDLGRITSGKLVLEVGWVDLAAVIGEAIASVQLAADQRQIAIRTILNPAFGGIRGDRKRLQQIVWNLLSNAIKFTAKGGKIIITLTRINSHVEITVADNGKGIAPDFLPFVFERFRQADAATTRQHGGLGIGLTLVKQLVEMHGGSVHAESPGLGQGATFIVTLPVAVAQESVAAQEADLAETKPNVIPSEELTGIKILVVDDDADSLEVVKRVLRSRHAEVATAESVDSAVQLFTSFRPHVILSDIGMPTQDGYELIRRIRSLPGGSNIPAAALTALARSEDRMRAMRAGFQTHLPKPVTPAELVVVVRSLASLNNRS